MADPVFSSLGLIGLFDACLNTYSRIGPMKDYAADRQSLWVDYQFERNRFEVLREELKCLDASSPGHEDGKITGDANYKRRYVRKNLQHLLKAQEGQVKKGDHLSQRYNPGPATQRWWWPTRSAAPEVVPPHINEPSDCKGPGVDRVPTFRRLVWATADKSRLAETIQYLKTCNDQLELVAPFTAAHCLHVRGKILSGANDDEELRQLSQDSNAEHWFISRGAMLKRMQLAYEKSPSTGNPAGHRIHKEFPRSANRTSAQMIVDPERGNSPVLIEWRSGFLTTGSLQESETRLNNLVEMLQKMSTAEPDVSSSATINFKIPECIGWVTNTPDFRSIGLVFRYPEPARRLAKQQGRVPRVTTLQDRIEAYRKGECITMPSLGARFELAVGLAEALGNLFVVNWVHRGLRSHNILFFGESLDAPHLSGFTYARPGEELEFSNAPDEDPDFRRYRPENYSDLLLHYDCSPSEDRILSLPSTIGLDMYALGVILLEIAEWRTIKDMDHGESSRDLGPLIRRHVEALGARVGEIYQGVVELCLREGSGDWQQKTTEEAMKVVVAVIEQLSKCHA